MASCVLSRGRWPDSRAAGLGRPGTQPASMVYRNQMQEVRLKVTRDYERAVNDRLNREEREILERFHRGELRPVTGVVGEMTIARQAARTAFKKHGKGGRKHEHDAHHD